MIPRVEVGILDYSDRTGDGKIIKLTGRPIARMARQPIGSRLRGREIIAQRVQWITGRLFLRLAHLLLG